MTTTPAVPRDSGHWRTSLTDYLAPAAVVSEGTALGLQWELRELTPYTTHRWNGPTSKSVRGAADQPESTVERADYRLAVRPVVRTARGFARGSLTWTNLPHMRNRLALQPEQHRWMSQFAALYRAGLPVGQTADNDWLYLDEFTNPVLWSMLDQAEALGVTMLGATARTTVRRAAIAELRLDVRRDGDDLRLDPVLTLDDTPHALACARPIGDHGIYTFDLALPRTLRLAPTAAPLRAEQLALLGGRSDMRLGVRIPAAESGEFLGEFVPQLRTRIEVASADGSVPLPQPAPPALVVTARFRARNGLDLAWSWAATAHGATVPELATVLPSGILPASWYGQPLPLPQSLRGIDAAEIAATLLPKLEALPGVRVVREGTAPQYRELTGTPHLTVTTVPTEKLDWFDLGVVVTVDGRDIPFTPLFRALAQGRRKLLLVDGSYLSLRHPAFAPLVALIDESRDLEEWETGPVISRYQTEAWAELEEVADVVDAAPQWRALLAEAAADSPRPVPAPDGLTATLRPYQAEGFSWLAFLWRHRLGGILADDMGLGKTLQCLALIQHAANSAEGRVPFLVVAPTSVLGTWASEAARFTPGLRVRVIDATEARSGISVASVAADADVVVTSYALLRLDAEAFTEIAGGAGWAGLILDEAQFVKNAGTRIHEVVSELAIPVTIAVTGTPMENSLTELHALCALVAPGLLPPSRQFVDRFVRVIEEARPGVSRGRGAGAGPAVTAAERTARVGELRRRLRPFLLRRIKEQVAPELPPKQEQVLTVALEPAHRALYDVFLQRERQKLFGLLEDLDRNRFIVFRSLTLLRMLALDARLIDAEEYGDIPSSKLDVLLDQLDEVIAEGHRTLVFSQFTSYLARAAQRLDAAGIAYVMLDGSTRRREDVIAAFRTGTAPVFLISLKAGGFGLTLTEADYVFLLDPWWNPASEDQAIDRTHRIGQDKPVFVYRMIAEDTIEEKVMQLKARKAALFDAVIDDDELFSSSLDAADIRELLS